MFKVVKRAKLAIFDNKMAAKWPKMALSKIWKKRLVVFCQWTFSTVLRAIRPRNSEISRVYADANDANNDANDGRKTKPIGYGAKAPVT